MKRYETLAVMLIAAATTYLIGSLVLELVL